MVAKVVRLVPARERIKRDLAYQAVGVLGDLDLPRGLMVAIQRELFAAVEGRPSDGWRFTMLGVHQASAVWDAIRSLPWKDRPQEVRHVFDVCLAHLRMDDGEVMLSRDDIAAKVGIRSDEVSAAMSVLERMGAIIRERVRMPGIRGRGVVVYRVNPNVGWNGSLEVRAAEAKRAPPLLEVLQGGAGSG